MSRVTGDQLWEPTPEVAKSSRLGQFVQWRTGGTFATSSYDDVWNWSVRDLDGFWSATADWFGVRWEEPPTVHFAGDPEAGAGPSPPGTWCPGGRISFAGHALNGVATDRPTVIARSQTRGPVELTGAELREAVGRARVGLQRAGVGRGDRVAGYLPNIPEALIAFLAAASLGAVWTACPPEMGARGVLDRLAQVEPTVLFAVDGYRYGARTVERGGPLGEVVAALPSLRRTVVVPYLSASPAREPGWWTWDEFIGETGPAECMAVAFDHPLYILYSSGTTGRPKPIVHGHGGILLEHAKYLGFHHDLGPDDRFFWFTTTGWMMWNLLVSGLVVGAAVVLFDGDPAWPGPNALWEVLGQTATTVAGMGAGLFVAADKADLDPPATVDLGALRSAGSTGSPLPAAAARWFARRFASVPLASISGGTDVCTAFVGWSPLHPVWAGEISCRCLGAAVSVYDEIGVPTVGAEGELVVTAPLPSMPVGFWGDGDGTAYREAYFARWDGVWAHGDRATLTERGSLVISGRSDGTLNRGGVRMGTAEFYAVVEEFAEVADSLVVHVEDPGGGPGQLWLFVVVAEGKALDEVLEARLRAALRQGLSPRHVPDHIVAVSAVPRTFSGKKMEVPVKRLLAGAPLERALSVHAVANPEVLDEYYDRA